MSSFITLCSDSGTVLMWLKMIKFIWFKSVQLEILISKDTFTHLMGLFTQTWKFCDHLLTLVLFQTCITFICGKKYYSISVRPPYKKKRWSPSHQQWYHVWKFIVHLLQHTLSLPFTDLTVTNVVNYHCIDAFDIIK